MLQDLLNRYVDSFMSPRRAVRAVIDRVDSLEGVVVILGLSLAINSIILVVKLTMGGGAPGGVLPIVLFNLVLSIAAFGIMTFMVQGVGKLFGGRGEVRDVATALAWHGLVMVVFTPFLSFDSMAGAEGGFQLPQIVILGVAIWLLVNFIAEAHRFESTMKVAGVMLALLVIPAFLMVLLAR